eukprot:14210384-Heterocapsa_arctica.AAC.1
MHRGAPPRRGPWPGTEHGEGRRRPLDLAAVKSRGKASPEQSRGKDIARKRNGPGTETSTTSALQ